MASQAGQGGQAQVAGAAPGQRLHEQGLVGPEVHHSHLVVQQLQMVREGDVSVPQPIVFRERVNNLNLKKKNADFILLSTHKKMI